jgi:hypothetical protein
MTGMREEARSRVEAAKRELAEAKRALELIQDDLDECDRLLNDPHTSQEMKDAAIARRREYLGH